MQQYINQLNFQTSREISLYTREDCIEISNRENSAISIQRVYRRPETGIWPSMNYEEICSKLRDAGFEEEVIDIFKRNRIDVPVFLELDSEEFIQLKVDALGDRKRLISLQREIKSKVETV